MEETRNNRAVERRLKDALKNDRARIQVGRISHFGLLEMSRQRIRTGVLEGSTILCPHCAGAGTVRSVSSIALHVLRVLEDTLTKSASHDLVVRTRTVVALYILNQKRSHLRDIERRFGAHITIDADERMTGTVYHAIERGEPATGTPEPIEFVAYEDNDPEPVEEVVEVEEEIESDEGADLAACADAVEGGDEDGEDAGRRRRRRRRRRGRNGDRDASPQAADEPQPSDEGLDLAASAAIHEPMHEPMQPMTNGNRGGYWARERSDEPVPFAPAAEFESEPREVAHEPALADGDEPPAPAAAEAASEPAPIFREAIRPAAPRTEVFAPPPPSAPREPTEIVITEADPDRPKRGGWWQRAKASLGG
jgi:ribonuclease E